MENYRTRKAAISAALPLEAVRPCLSSSVLITRLHWCLPSFSQVEKCTV